MVEDLGPKKRTIKCRDPGEEREKKKDLARGVVRIDVEGEMEKERLDR